MVTIAIFFNIGIYQSFLKKWLQKLQFSSKIIEKDYFKIDTPNAYDQKELLYRVRKYNLTPPPLQHSFVVEGDANSTSEPCVLKDFDEK